jgi:hypothetical protein
MHTRLIGAASQRLHASPSALSRQSAKRAFELQAKVDGMIREFARVTSQIAELFLTRNGRLVGISLHIIVGCNAKKQGTHQKGPFLFSRPFGETIQAQPELYAASPWIASAKRPRDDNGA